MQALSCEKQLKGTGIITNIIHIMKEEGLTRPVRVRLIVIVIIIY
jgi:hypothetical protein